MTTMDEVLRLWHKLRLLNATYRVSRDPLEQAHLRALMFATYRKIRRLGISRSVFID